MSKYLSSPIALTFWVRLATRLSAEVDLAQKRVMTAAMPLPGRVEGAKEEGARIAASQEKLLAELDRLDSLTILANTLKLQLDNALASAGATGLEGRIAFLKPIADFYETFVKNRPNRAKSTHELSILRAAYTSANKPNGGEFGISERARLLAQVVDIPVISEEDSTPYAQRVHSLRNDLAAMASNLEVMLATSEMRLEVTLDLVDVLDELGIGIFEVFDQAQLDTAAESRQDNDQEPALVEDEQLQVAQA